MNLIIFASKMIIMLKMFWISVLLLFSFRLINGKHFLGGSMTWKLQHFQRKSSSWVNIDLIQRYMWKRQGKEYCDDWTKRRRWDIGSSSSVKCLSHKCPIDHYPSVRSPCTDYSEKQHWSATEKHSFIRIKRNASFEIALNKIDWSDELNKDKPLAASISTFISTIPRSNGKLNTPPLILVMPWIQYVRLHTMRSWKIPVSDADGDSVRCRWANSSDVDECGDVCNPPRNAHLNEDSCILTYNATQQKSVVIALKIEDFERNSSRQRLSSTSLQFIIRIDEDTLACDQPPRYVNQSKNDSIVQIPVCETIHEQIQFFTNCSHVFIKNVQISKPSDMVVDTLQRHTINHSLYTVNITWTPIYDDVGIHPVCFLPIDSIGQYGSLTCIQYLVVDNNTEENVSNILNDCINGSMTPVGLIDSNQSYWTFRYDRVMRPSNQSDAFIRFYALSTHDEIYQINVRTSLKELNHSGTSFEFFTQFNWTGGEQYYILFDRGILVDATKCGQISPAVHDPSFWTFEIPSKNNNTKRPLFFVAPICDVGSECDVFKKYCSRSNPCQNNGTCENRNTLPSQYTCACSSDFSGIHCEIDNRPCHPNPCFNFGTCNPTSNTTFNCSCSSPWEGRFCEKRINYCHGITCQNGGVCQSLSDKWVCKCLGDGYYYGRYCEFTTTKIMIYKLVSKSFAYVAIIVMIVVAAFVIIMDILKYGFGINLVHEERERLRQERRAKRRHFVMRRYGYVNKADESHVAAASFPVVVEPIA